MPKLPTVAIIGRPNTGKSTLFNRLVGRRKAIVSEIPGTTRDHIAHKMETEDLDFLLIDTGGMGGGTEDKEIEDDVHLQSTLALENADLIVFTINSREELTASDFEITEELRRNRKAHVPVIIVLTKCDNPENTDELLPQYYALGITDQIIPISATHNFGMDELVDTITDELKKLNFEKSTEEESEHLPHIAIVGKPNVGKSSFINALMSEPQKKTSSLLVSDIPGTTRDATDTVIKYHDQDYVFIDTAGIRRRSKTDRGIETFAYLRSVQAMGHSDIAILILDATQPVSKQDKRIACLAIEEGKGLLILLNKTDLLSSEEKKAALENAKLELAFCKFASFVCISAENKSGILKIFDQD
ncbi:ribosome biogenesis GTPase Der, partial [Patescibacteria group bacterium]|nr:ribosome biogenesis GTPase Der [Patescibacteria group bacterium]